MQRNKIVIFAVMLLSCFGLASVFLFSEKPPKVNPRIVSANNEFAFNLYRETLKEKGNENVFISPLSASIVLSMIYNGAEGETKEQLADILGVKGMSTEEMNQSNAALIESITNPGRNVHLSVANSLWANSNIPINPQYAKRVKEQYKAGVTNLDFNNPHVPSTINAWVRDKTAGKIDNIVSEINSGDVLLLVDAIYFNGEWTKKFDKKLTKDMEFHLLDGTTKMHPMMHQEGKYKFYGGTFSPEGFSAVRLPYGKGRYSMYIFLPNYGSTLDQFYENLNRENWEKWMSGFTERDVNIFIPKFKLQPQIDLQTTLKACGVGMIFDPSDADLGGMCNSNAWISEFKQKTFIEVNEEGTKAAAATHLRSTLSAGLRMVIDHPFFLVIRDDASGLILFMGSVTNPGIEIQ